MELLQLKATTTTVSQEEGVFEAIISTASEDREGDIVSPQGVVMSLLKWVPFGKKLPLSWNHSLAPADIFGYINPESARVYGDNEVSVKGWVDRDTEVGREAWRLVKTGVLGFSYGYLPTNAPKRSDGRKGRNILELDIYEITVTPAPMNGETRILSYKAAKGASTVGPAAREHLSSLIKYYMSKPHPFGTCVKDNTHRFGEEGAKKVCATLKDMGDPGWRSREKMIDDES